MAIHLFETTDELLFEAIEERNLTTELTCLVRWRSWLLAPDDVHCIRIDKSPPPLRGRGSSATSETAHINSATRIVPTLPLRQKSPLQNRIKMALIIADRRYTRLEKGLHVDEHQLVAAGDDVLGMAISRADGV